MRALFGSARVQQLRSEVGWDPSSGDYVVERYRGLDADLRGFIPWFREEGFRFRIIPDKGPYSILELRAGDALDGQDQDQINSDLTTVWELAGNELQKDLYDFPGIALGGGDPTSIQSRALAVAEIRRVLANIQAGRYGLSGAIADTNLNEVAEHVLYLRVLGQDSFEVSQFVLKRSTILPKKYSEKWSVSNVNKQWTTDQLRTDFEIPDTIKFNLPEGAWLKRTPTLRQQKDGKYIAEDQWWHGDEIDEVIYPEREVEA